MLGTPRGAIHIVRAAEPHIYLLVQSVVGALSFPAPADIRMPGMSGVEVVRRATARHKRQFPIVAMTAHVDPEALKEFRYKSNRTRQ